MPHWQYVTGKFSIWFYSDPEWLHWAVSLTTDLRTKSYELHAGANDVAIALVVKYLEYHFGFFWKLCNFSFQIQLHKQ